MPDHAMNDHGDAPRAVSRRAFLSTGAAGIGAAVLVTFPPRLGPAAGGVFFVPKNTLAAASDAELKRRAETAERVRRDETSVMTT